MTRLPRTCLTLCLLLALDALSAPIRVGIFKGTGPNRYWHTSIHTAGTAIASILANPDSSGLGAGLAHAPSGFAVSMYGIDPSCTNGCSPNPAQKAAFIAALDSLDVVIVSNFVDIGGVLADTEQRARFARFIRTKGLVSNHWSIDSYGSWPAWDSLHGARFQNKVSSDRDGTIRLDSAAMTDPAWRTLNRGLPDTTRFLEEWISFTTNANVIRAAPGLKVTVNLDEASLNGGLGGMRAMGDDHPYSWYREFPEGGRLFYTGLGHRATLYTGTNTNFLQRQLYNAILWAAGYNENTGTALRDERLPSVFSAISRFSFSGGALTISLLRDGAHTVEILALDGRRVTSRRGAGRVEHRIEGLRPGVYTVSVTAGGQRLARLVTIP